MTGLMRRVGADWTARRLLKAGWRELARLGAGEPVSLEEFNARMVDRISLLTPRLGQLSNNHTGGGIGADQAAGAFHDLRVGLNMTVLQTTRTQLGRGAAALAPVMTQLSSRYARLPAVDPVAEAALLDAVDNALRAICSGTRDRAQQEALAALTSVRRDLFPQAAAYLPTEQPIDTASTIP
jgi:hypothetical protein